MGMHLLTAPDIRKSFVNTTKGEASRINLPDDLDVWTPKRWAHTDFLGWVDPRAPQQAAIVAPDGDGGLVGVRLRRNATGGGRAKMCSICCTVHPGSGVALMVAARAGKAGRDGNTVGLDICADLQCPGYVRGWLPAPTLTTLVETLPLEDRVARMRLNLESFLRRIRR